MMDLAADELGLDPVEIRRRNFIQPADFPFKTIPGAHYDIGDYDLPLREALRLVDYDKVREEQATRREAGDPVMLGIGVSVYVEITAGGGGTEFGSVTVHADGSATISAGTSGHGQGHPTAFAMLASDRSASRWRRSASCSPTPRPCRAAAGPAARGRCRWAATPSRRGRGRAGAGQAAGRGRCWRRRSTT